MTIIEQALNFDCAGDSLLGIVSVPDRVRDVGIVIIVGGPQYRVGSHRQFVHIARRLAREGFPAMRFDYRGMGDSGGAARSFEDVSEDIGAAIAALQRACPRVEKVVLWGLCDAASAALLYLDGARSEAVAGLVLVNPWVRAETTLAKAQVKHYYSARLFERQFWTKLLRGGVDIADAWRGFARTARIAFRSATVSGRAPRSFRERMASGLSAFRGPVLLVLSGRDLTAREFDEHSRVDPEWRRLLTAENVERCEIEDADHTFSDAHSRDAVETATVGWLERHLVGAAR